MSCLIESSIPSFQSLLKEINKVSEYFKDTIKKEGLSLNPFDWDLSVSLSNSLNELYFRFNYLREIPSGVLKNFARIKIDNYWHLKTKRCKGAFNVTSSFIGYIIICPTILFKDFINREDLASDLTPLIFRGNISNREFQQILKKGKKMPYLDEFAEIFNNWFMEAGYNQSGKIGRKLYKIMKYFPQFSKSPSNVLYRGIRISEDLFHKVKTEGKSLVLKNRAYSSWTYDIEAAKTFSGQRLNYGTVTIILKRKFNKNQIIANIEDIGLFMEEHGRNSASLTSLQAEQEIVVYNSQNNFIFKPYEIYLYTFYNNFHPSWQKFRVKG